MSPVSDEPTSLPQHLRLFTPGLRTDVALVPVDDAEDLLDLLDSTHGHHWKGREISAALPGIDASGTVGPDGGDLQKLRLAYPNGDTIDLSGEDLVKFHENLKSILAEEK